MCCQNKFTSAQLSTQSQYTTVLELRNYDFLYLMCVSRLKIQNQPSSQRSRYMKCRLSHLLPLNPVSSLYSQMCIRLPGAASLYSLPHLQLIRDHEDLLLQPPSSPILLFLLQFQQAFPGNLPAMPSRETSRPVKTHFTSSFTLFSFKLNPHVSLPAPYQTTCYVFSLFFIPIPKGLIKSW